MKNNLKKQKGFSLIVVLMTMILATLVVSGLYLAVKQYMKQSEIALKYATAETTSDAAKEQIEAWLNFKGMEVAASFQTYYDNIQSGDTAAVLLPIQDTTLDGGNQHYSARLVGLDWSSTPFKVKIQLDARGRDGTRKVSSQLYSVSGVYFQEITSVSTQLGLCGPDVALWMGNGSGTLNGTIDIDSGGAYFGQKIAMNHPNTMTINGDLIYGDNADGKSYLNGCVEVQGNFYAKNPVELTDNCNGATSLINGHAYFKSGFTNTLRTSLTITGDATFGGTSIQIQDAKTLWVKGNANFIANYTPSGGASRLQVDGDANFNLGPTLNVDQPGVNIVNINKDARFVNNATLSGNANLNVSGSAWFDAVPIISHSSAKLIVSSTNYTSTNLPSLLSWRPTGVHDTVTIADTLKYISDQLDATGKKPLGFVLTDSATIQSKKQCWSSLVTKAKAAGIITSERSAVYFNPRDANKMSNNAAFVSANGHNGFLVVDWGGSSGCGYTGGTASNMRTVYATDTSISGKWIFTAGSGTIEFNSSWYPGNAEFPNSLSTARVVIWTFGTANLLSFGIAGSVNDFYGIIYHSGTGAYSSNATAGEGSVNVHGAIYLNNTGGISITSENVYKADLNKQVIRDISIIGVANKNTNGDTTLTCGANVTADTNVTKYFRVMSPRLSVKYLGGFVEQKSLKEVLESQGRSDADSIYNSQNVSKPFVDFSRNGISISSGTYANLSVMRDSLDVEPIVYWDGQLRTNLTSSSTPCRASWTDPSITDLNNTTVYPTYTVTCSKTVSGSTQSVSFARKLSVVIGSVANSNTSSTTGTSTVTGSTTLSSATQSSSISIGTSSAAVDPCSGITAWTNKAYEWVGASNAEYVTYSSKLYYHTDWVNATPGTDAKWIFVANCGTGVSSSSVVSSSSMATVATPVMSPLTGTYASAQTVSITTTTSGATIYYTLDGTNPTTTSSVYSSALTISTTSTLKAIAIKSGMNNSSVASETYTITGTVATPTFSPVSGTSFTSSQNVTIATTTSGATIYYTTDGSTPTTSSTLYTGTIALSSTTTIKAIAAKSGWTNSAVASATFTKTAVSSVAASSVAASSSSAASTPLTTTEGTYTGTKTFSVSAQSGWAQIKINIHGPSWGSYTSSLTIKVDGVDQTPVLTTSDGSNWSIFTISNASHTVQVVGTSSYVIKITQW